MVHSLPPNQKTCVAKMGFEAFLKMPTCCNVDNIFIWLVKHFNTLNSSIELENGFNFPITPLVVHKILGIPLGGAPLHTRPTSHTCNIIDENFSMVPPSTEYLISLVRDDLPDEAFSRIFMLIVLSTVIAPNSQGLASQEYYSALVDTNSVHNHDWCLFALSYLLASIKKLKLNLSKGIECQPEGCRLLLVVSLFSSNKWKSTQKRKHMHFSLSFKCSPQIFLTTDSIF